MEKIKCDQQRAVSQSWLWAVGIRPGTRRVRPRALPSSWEVLTHYLPFFVPVYIQKPDGIIYFFFK